MPANDEKRNDDSNQPPLNHDFPPSPGMIRRATNYIRYFLVVIPIPHLHLAQIIPLFLPVILQRLNQR